MSRQQGLLKRGSRWYSNIKVPSDLREVLGKSQIRDSLGTSDYREACRKIVLEKARWQVTLQDERKILARNQPRPLPSENRLVTALSESEAFAYAVRYLASKEG